MAVRLPGEIIRDPGLATRGIPDFVKSQIAGQIGVPQLALGQTFETDIGERYEVIQGSEGGAALGIRKTGQAGDSNDLIAQAQKLRDFNIQANQPAIQNLEAGKEPLKQRYQQTLDEIKRREGVEKQQTSTALSREFGRRGIPLSSGVFDEALLEKLRPIGEFFTGQFESAQTGLEESLLNIQSLIAKLQTGSPLESIQAALSLNQLQEQSRQNAIQNALAQRQFEEGQRQFNETLNFQKSGSTEDPFSRFATLGEGQTLFDLITGKSVFTAPKTFKPSGGGGGDPLGLF